MSKCIRSAVLVVFCVLTSVSVAFAKTSSFVGRIVHVSTDNLKVTDQRSDKTLSFLILPHFDQLFSTDGKTTYQMRRLHPGMFVKIYYDQSFLGARHADKIVLRHGF